MTELVPADSVSGELISHARVGMRLHGCEIYNWGTFHGEVWRFEPSGNNALLTGDIGSGKSTLVDAITTLLVPAQKAAYNKAAGADTRERDLRSYVLGHYKAERSEYGSVSKPVALRTPTSHSIILARFRNEGFGQDVTLAQFFWFREPMGQPDRFFVVAEAPLSIAEHFSKFDSVPALRKRLRAMARVEVHDTFPPYAAAFRRRFGIESDQALELFHQTVSMKTVGNLTDFVRQHMLEAFPVEDRIRALTTHFDDLLRAHELVLRAKDQITRLGPLIADCDRHADLQTHIETLRECREALRAFFGRLKGELLDEQIAGLQAEMLRYEGSIATCKIALVEGKGERDAVKQAIAENGGDRLERLSREIAEKKLLQEQREKLSIRYDTWAQSVGLPQPADIDTFLANRGKIAQQIEVAQARDNELQNDLMEATISLRAVREQHEILLAEIVSLKTRRSNVPASMLALRERLCAALSLDEADLPFAGELIEVRADALAWEGAAERVLRGFAVSLLVNEGHYQRVSAWVDQNHLAGRLVYFRVRPSEQRSPAPIRLESNSLVYKLSVQPTSKFGPWIEAYLARRFDYACCETLDEFRRQPRALSRAGQIKSGGERHEKDDRSAIGDRTQYVLGWSNEAKIAALESKATGLEGSIAHHGAQVASLQSQRRDIGARQTILNQMSMIESFDSLDWISVATDVERLEKERQDLEATSDILKVLQGQLDAIEKRLVAQDEKLTGLNKQHNQAELRIKLADEKRAECSVHAESTPSVVLDKLSPRLQSLLTDVRGKRIATADNCDGLQQEVRERAQSEIDAEDKKLKRLGENIVGAMRAYMSLYPQETREIDATIEAAPEFKTMLDGLQRDSLPRFEARFKQLLNENTVREIANFQSQLNGEVQTIKERIEKINRSLRGIDYNSGRFILLEALETTDSEVRDFRRDLRSCTEDALTGSEEDAYSESKFQQIKNIIDCFRERPETADLDRRWTRKVTDVRNWFVFSASERWREDGREHEHYADSGGKSGGQKEKLAYTVLAASLAYQFGLDAGKAQSRTFHFVLIDEAFARGSDDSARYGLELFQKMGLQLLIVTPLQKIQVIEPYVASVGFVHNKDGANSMLRNLTIEEYRKEHAARGL